MRNKVSQLLPRSPRLAGASLLAVPALIAAGIGVAAPASGSTAPAAAHGVKQVNLVSDQAGKAQFMDPKLINPWGLAQSPTSPLWSANNGSDSATLYSGGSRRLAGGEAGARGRCRRRTDRPGFQRHHRLRRLLDGRLGSRAVHLRHRGRGHQGLEPGRRTDHRPYRRSRQERGLQGPRTAPHPDRPLPARRRLPQRPDRRVQLEVPPGAAPSTVLHRPAVAARLRAVQRRGPEQLDLRQLRQAGRHAP